MSDKKNDLIFGEFALYCRYCETWFDTLDLYCPNCGNILTSKIYQGQNKFCY